MITKQDARICIEFYANVRNDSFAGYHLSYFCRVKFTGIKPVTI